ncbi:FUSC family protein [Sphingomonas sp. RS6]
MLHSRRGFPDNRLGGAGEPLRFAAHTTLAALLGMAVAWLAGLHHPWWAGMTVWLVAQPSRGLLLERVVARLSGTVIGAAAGEAMLLWLKGAPLPTLTALTLWVGICAAGGSLFRHFRTYTFVLSGYSAAIVVLFALGASPGASGDVALDRILCTIIGIVCSSIVAFGLGPRRETVPLEARLDDLVARTLDAVAGAPAESRNALLIAIAALHREADDLAAGSAAGRRTARTVHRVAPLLVALLARRRPMQEGECGETAVLLAELRAAIDSPDAGLSWDWFRSTLSPGRTLRAALRPMLAIALASVLWLGLNWPFGAMMTVAAVLFASLFSSHAQGNRALLHALAGCLCGALLGLVFRFALSTMSGDPLWALLGLFPVLFLGAVLMRLRPTGKLAIDLNMTFLLTARPLTPAEPFGTTMAIGAAIIAGVTIAAVTYWLVLPASVSTSRRLLRRRAIGLYRKMRGLESGGRRDALRRALSAIALRELELEGGQRSPTLHVLAAALRMPGRR